MDTLGVRILERVSPNSLASDWNHRNPGRDARKGDQLVRVNGVGGSAEKMSLELKKNAVRCEFKPAQPRVPQAAKISPKASEKPELAPLAPVRAPAAAARRLQQAGGASTGASAQQAEPER
eukprot:TRINITY_DN1626_c0_g1_i8.p4 TRINITY_DN1626_c0_g1~~TRINITY_DN1626_c0_g1_i8.p4  ORF type:complete len:121 (+),score=21.59 TRINITY_DN1626_c0_g1_i8:716-1078(+)